MNSTEAADSACMFGAAEQGERLAEARSALPPPGFCMGLQLSLLVRWSLHTSDSHGVSVHLVHFDVFVHLRICHHQHDAHVHQRPPTHQFPPAPGNYPACSFFVTVD